MKTWLLLGYKSLNAIENSMLGKGYKKPKEKNYLSGIILFPLNVSAAFIQSSYLASTSSQKIIKG